MSKDKYWQYRWNEIDKMDLEQLRQYAKKLDASAQAYFHNWQESVQEINRLIMDHNKKHVCSADRVIYPTDGSKPQCVDCGREAGAF